MEVWVAILIFIGIVVVLALLGVFSKIFGFFFNIFANLVDEGIGCLFRSIIWIIVIIFIIFIIGAIIVIAESF